MDARVDGNFSKIQSFFRGTPYEKNMNDLECIVYKKPYAHVLGLVYKGTSRYFYFGADLVESVVQTIIKDTPLSQDEHKLLEQMRAQLHSYQIQLEFVSHAEERIIDIVKQQPGFQGCFPVPSPSEEVHRYAINIEV